MPLAFGMDTMGMEMTPIYFHINISNKVPLFSTICAASVVIQGDSWPRADSHVVLTEW